MKKLLVVLTMAATFLGLAATPVSASTIGEMSYGSATTSSVVKPEPVAAVYAPNYGCHDFLFGLFTPGVSYNGAGDYFESGTYRTAGDQSCNGGQVLAWFVEWVPQPAPSQRCGYLQPIRYTLNGVFVAAGTPVRACQGTPTLLGTYGGNTRLGFRWWHANPALNHDQQWARVLVRL